MIVIFVSLQVFDSITREVQKGAKKCGVASFAVGCKIDSNRDISKFGVTFPDIPGSPLALWVEENPEAMQSLERAMTSAQLQLVMLRSAKKSGNKEMFAKLWTLKMKEKMRKKRSRMDLETLHPLFQ